MLAGWPYIFPPVMTSLGFGVANGKTHMCCRNRLRVSTTVMRPGFRLRLSRQQPIVSSYSPMIGPSRLRLRAM